jgi:hypothetical protein
MKISSCRIEIGKDDMAMREEGKVNKLPPGDPRRRQTDRPISSLNEAWFRILDRCVISLPLSEIILPLMRDCFFAGATYAVILLQKGQGDELTRDIAGFINEEPRSVPPQAP